MNEKPNELRSAPERRDAMKQRPVEIGRRLIKASLVAQKLGVSVTTVYRMIKRGEFPEGGVVSGKLGTGNSIIRWDEVEVDAWIANWNAQKKQKAAG
jgi:predicted DNA-binding transcriptional regulator AlpA